MSLFGRQQQALAEVDPAGGDSHVCMVFVAAAQEPRSAARFELPEGAAKETVMVRCIAPEPDELTLKP